MESVKLVRLDATAAHTVFLWEELPVQIALPLNFLSKEIVLTHAELGSSMMLLLNHVLTVKQDARFALERQIAVFVIPTLSTFKMLLSLKSVRLLALQDSFQAITQQQPIMIVSNVTLLVRLAQDLLLLNV